MNILPFCRIFSPCCWQVSEEQTGRMVSTHYLAVIGTWCKNCREVSSLEECILVELIHTFWHGTTKLSIIRDRNTQFTRRGWKPLLLFIIDLAFKPGFGQKKWVRWVSSTVPLSLIFALQQKQFRVSPSVPCLIPMLEQGSLSPGRNSRSWIGHKADLHSREGRYLPMANLRNSRSLSWKKPTQITMRKTS